MADLKPVIRLKTHHLDRQKQALAALYRQQENLETEKKELFEELDKERDIAAQDPSVDGQFNFLRYADSVKKRGEELDQAMRELQIRINGAQNMMRESFAELKKIEMVQDQREAEEDAAQRKKEDQEMDDIGIEQHRRNQDKET